MARTFAVAGHRPYRWGRWVEDHAGHGPGHVGYEAVPGESIHEGWLDKGEDVLRAIKLGLLAEGPKTKDAPDAPPDEMVRSFQPGNALNAPDGHPLRDAPDAAPVAEVAPAPAPEPETEPAAEPAPADDTAAPAEAPATPTE